MRAPLFLSTDSGVTWKPHGATRSWYSVATSADGNKLIASAYVTNLQVSGRTGSIVARPSSLVELTYTGNGQFFVSNVQGTVEEP